VKKLITVFTILLIVIVGCQKPINQKKERYVKEYDTVYKPNSFDIDYVKRTFYKHEDYSTNTYLNQIVGKDEITFFWLRKEKGQLTHKNEANYVKFENENEFIRFLNLVDTLQNNTDKNLKFDFDKLGMVRLNTSTTLNRVELTHVSIVSGIGHGFYNFNKNEIDSIRDVFNKYKSE
jgi:hypothetical protein